jgi:hypothetical protein
MVLRMIERAAKSTADWKDRKVEGVADWYTSNSTNWEQVLTGWNRRSFKPATIKAFLMQQPRMAPVTQEKAELMLYMAFDAASRLEALNGIAREQSFTGSGYSGSNTSTVDVKTNWGAILSPMFSYNTGVEGVQIAPVSSRGPLSLSGATDFDAMKRLITSGGEANLEAAVDQYKRNMQAAIDKADQISGAVDILVDARKGGNVAEVIEAINILSSVTGSTNQVQYGQIWTGLDVVASQAKDLGPKGYASEVAGIVTDIAQARKAGRATLYQHKNTVVSQVAPPVTMVYTGPVNVKLIAESMVYEDQRAAGRKAA